MFCPMCGAPNEDDAEYCGNCGAALSDDAPLEAAGEAVEKDVEEIHEKVEDVVDEAWDDLPDEPPLLPAAPPPAPPAPTARAYTPPRAPAAAVPTSGMAIASLVLGIGGLTVLPFLGSVVAIVLGYMARRDIRGRPGEVTGDGLALAGIVLGWIAVGLAVAGVLVVGGISVCGICGALGMGAGVQ